jgi:type II secretory pathway pseudopilin PulG
MLVVSLVFTVISGAVFSLLLSSQIQYRRESNLTATFQQANVAIDQITRDVHSAGYPPVSSFSTAVCQNRPQNVATPFAWSPGYFAKWPCNTPRTPAIPCSVGFGCAVPGAYDLILEADLGGGAGVQWIRYSLSGTTLMRGATPKDPTADPLTFTDSVLTPYLEGVLNGTNSPSVPIFSYEPDPTIVPGSFGPEDIREVNICLIVQSSKPDPQTGQLRSVTLTGQAIRLNPTQ